MDREYFNIEVLGFNWEIQLMEHFDGMGSSENNMYYVSDGCISINFRAIRNKDQMLTVLFDALFDGVLDKYCGEDWDTKFIANVVSQLFNSQKSNKTISDIVKYFNRYNMNGEEYEMFDEDGERTPYLLDSIDISKPFHWEFELYIANIKTANQVEFSRFGMTETYTLTMDPTKFDSGEEMAKKFEDFVLNTVDATFEGLDDIKSQFTLEKLKRRLKSTNFEAVKQRLIDEYDELASDFE